MCIAKDSSSGEAGGQAPSEKHLENYLWKHPEALGVSPSISRNAGKPLFTFPLRQVSFPSGVVDLIGSCSDHRIAVCEIKKGKINSAAFAQLWRYLRDIQFMFWDLFFSDLSELRPILQVESLAAFWAGVLVGSSIENDILLACEAADIMVFTYEYRDGIYLFTQRATDHPTGFVNGISDSLYGLVTDLLQKRADWCFRRGFDAVMAAAEYVDALLDGDEQS